MSAPFGLFYSLKHTMHPEEESHSQVTLAFQIELWMIQIQSVLTKFTPSMSRVVEYRQISSESRKLPENCIVPS
jgi:hypothetical protein